MARRRDLVTVLDEHERDIRRLRATLARVSGVVPDHGDLTGLDGNDHPQYLLLAGGTMTGDIAAGGNSITGLDSLTGGGTGTISGFDSITGLGGTIAGSPTGTQGLTVKGSGAGEHGIYIETPDGGHSWISYNDYGDHYHSFDAGGAGFFVRQFNNPNYTTLMNVRRERTIFNHGIKIDSALDQTYEDGQIRLTYSGNSKSFLLRRDNSTLYFLISDTEDGTWNSTRPLGIHQDGYISHLGNINDNVEPNSNKVFHLGSSSLRWNTIYGSVVSLDNEIQLPTGGSTSDPSLTWDSDTGLYSPADGDLRVTCNNSQVWYWTNTETRAYNHFDPGADNTYDLGDASLSWRRLYAYDIYDNDGIRRMDLDSSGWFNFMSDVGNTRFQVGNDTVIFNDEIQGTSAMTPTGSTAYKSIVHDATTYRFYRYTSKRAIKENIRHLPKAVSAKLYDLTPRFFDMKEANRTGDEWADFDQPGFIADEVWDVFGDVAAPPDENGEPSGWTERYMIPLMVSELQDHEAENIKQQGQINNLRERVRVLEALVETMMEAQT